MFLSPASHKSQGLGAGGWGRLRGGPGKANPSTPEASSLPLTPDKREIPPWEPFRTRPARGPSSMGLWASIPSCAWERRGEGMPTALPCLTHFADKAHSVGAALKKPPGHPVAKPSPDQRGTPPCSWLGLPHLFSTHPIPAWGTHVNVCVQAQAPSLGPQASLLTEHDRNHQLNTAVGLGPTDPVYPLAGGHLGSVPGD